MSFYSGSWLRNFVAKAVITLLETDSVIRINFIISQLAVKKEVFSSFTFLLQVAKLICRCVRRGSILLCDSPIFTLPEYDHHISH